MKGIRHYTAGGGQPVLTDAEAREMVDMIDRDLWLFGLSYVMECMDAGLYSLSKGTKIADRDEEFEALERAVRSFDGCSRRTS